MIWRITYHCERDEEKVLRCLTGTKSKVLHMLAYLIDIDACDEIIWIDHLTNPKWSTIKNVIRNKGLWIHFRK